MTTGQGQEVPRRRQGFDSRPGPLVLLRHGESTANRDGLFTGVWDVPLSDRGRRQARRAARLLLDAGDLPDLVLTSPLRRATETVDIVLEELGQVGLAQLASPEMTERGYGALTGLPKSGVSEIFGAGQIREWRRSMTGRPPRLSDLVNTTRAGGLRPMPGRELLLAEVPASARAAAETSERFTDVVTRVRRCADTVLTPHLRTGKCILVVAHGNSLRALVSLLDALDDPKTERLNIPTGEPLRYDVSTDGVAVRSSGRYLDPDSAYEAAMVVASEGGT